MNFTATNKLENEIIKLDGKEIQDRILNAKNQNERDFWVAIQDRALQLRQGKVIKGKFVR
ncbi:MAG: hypothetical protein SPG45_01380 [Lactobacillus johnsonii]|uniref:hypothetical protein n=1 Tax=Lactobacillus johnsonii TaxID=33959 RepID=UPI000214D555|nr:hypothetical protein [Lactobacillus johnsonii]MDY2638465.1 hypothetical protein [Ligilactobacillus salivarius]MCI7590574.1 hypothetical protein [Lactobacillus johnsonii]MCI7647705.1 hypothetical protein [Lactobacillus johnsonii]MDD7005972.1 hypothetical protein [Lactobacillus johnsonii]MDY4501008.1 hypothetical protein [Lactobacillus johnsonii]